MGIRSWYVLGTTFIAHVAGTRQAESGYSAQILNAAASGAAGRAAAQARAVLGNSSSRTAVAASYLALVTRFAERTGGGTAARHRVAPLVWQGGTERGVRAQRGPSVRERCRN